MPYTIPTTKEIELPDLTATIKKVVPNFEGMELKKNIEVTARRLTGDFTDSEKTSILSEVNSHDAIAIRKSKSDKDKLTKGELKKDPATMLVTDRFKRIELFLGIDTAIG